MVLLGFGFPEPSVAETAIICAGHVNYDVTLHTTSVPDPDYSSPIEGEHTGCGGSAVNTALTLASLGRDVSIAGSVGDDEHGAYVGNALERAGVDSILLDGGVPTTVIYAIITEDASPRYLARHEAVGEWGLGDIPEDTWNGADHLHVTSFDRSIGGELARAAADAGKTVSFNPSQGYQRDEFDAIVDAADVIFLNEREANMFRSRHDFEATVEDSIVVMTHGAAGSTAYTPHGVVTHSGFESGEIADTIGAGDAFVAGFLDEWITDDDFPDIKQALAEANACGARAITRVGAPDEIDSDDVDALIEK